MFCMNLAINNINFYDQHEEYDICSGNTVCLNELSASLEVKHFHKLLANACPTLLRKVKHTIIHILEFSRQNQ
jgi:hypothetical protein